MLLSAVQTTLITDSTFTSNHKNSTTFNSFISNGGGAILSTTSHQISIINSTFDDNTATNDGGAIHVSTVNDQDSSLSLSNCTFQRNKAVFGSGGALFVSGVDSFNIESSSFTNCSAAVAGGSVFASAASTLNAPTAIAFINSTAFVGSLVGVLPPGGWGPVSDTVLGLKDVTLQPQFQGGGGMFFSSFQFVNMLKCVFEACSSVRSKGGGLRIRAGVRVELTSVFFTHCSAAAAGALSVSSMLQLPGVYMGLRTTEFINNSASTQLECPSSTCVEPDSTLVGTQGDGGAVSVDGCGMNFYNQNTFSFNSAAGRGGAVFAQRPAESPVIFFMFASTSGKSFFSVESGSAPYPIHTSFSNNTALISGGAMAIRGYQLDLGTPTDESLFALAFTLFYGNVAPTGERAHFFMRL